MYKSKSKSNKLLKMSVFAFIAIAASSCKLKEPTPDPTLLVNFYSATVGDKQVEFYAMSNYGSFHWNFDDGNTSTEKNPVHTYDEGGTYFVTLSVTGEGVTKEITKKISLALSNLQMLAGDQTFPNGKKWKLSYYSGDRLGEAVEGFPVTGNNSTTALASGILDQIDLGWAYEDEFLFKSDGSYQRIPKNGGSYGSSIYATIKDLTLLKVGTQGFNAFCYAACPAAEGAEYRFVEQEDLTIFSGIAMGNVTFKDVMTLSFTKDEFIGFLDFNKKCIITSLTPERMTLALFFTGVAELAPLNGATHALVLSFVPVN